MVVLDFISHVYHNIVFLLPSLADFVPVSVSVSVFLLFSCLLTKLCWRVVFTLRANMKPVQTVISQDM